MGRQESEVGSGEGRRATRAETQATQGGRRERTLGTFGGFEGPPSPTRMKAAEKVARALSPLGSHHFQPSTWQRGQDQDGTG